MVNSLPIRRLRNRVGICIKTPLRNGGRKREVFVLTTPRSGSELFISYLNSHPDASLASEILNRKAPIGLRERFVSRRALRRHVKYSVRARSSPVSGAKLLLTQLEDRRISPDDLHTLFPEARFIILYRRSLAQQYVSVEIAAMTKRWHSKREGDVFQGTISVEPKALLKFCGWVRGQYDTALNHEWLKEYGIVAAYEEIVADPVRFFNEKAFPFLGMSPAAVHTRLVRLNPRPLSSVVANFEEVRGLLTGEQTVLELEM